MAKTQGAISHNAHRFLVPNQFHGLPNNLRVWNTCNVFMNLGCISESLAERYMDMNLKPEDTALAHAYLERITKIRHPMYGTRRGDVVHQDTFTIDEWVH